MIDRPDLDPIRKSRREAALFNETWLKHGEKTTWIQRIGFAVFSLCMFGFRLFFLAIVLSDFHEMNLLGALGWGVPMLLFLVPGALGVRNVLRF